MSTVRVATGPEQATPVPGAICGKTPAAAPAGRVPDKRTGAKPDGGSIEVSDASILRVGPALGSALRADRKEDGEAPLGAILR